MRRSQLYTTLACCTFCIFTEGFLVATRAVKGYGNQYRFAAKNIRMHVVRNADYGNIQFVPLKRTHIPETTETYSLSDLSARIYEAVTAYEVDFAQVDAMCSTMVRCQTKKVGDLRQQLCSIWWLCKCQGGVQQIWGLARHDNERYRLSVVRHTAPRNNSRFSQMYVNSVELYAPLSIKNYFHVNRTQLTNDKSVNDINFHDNSVYYVDDTICICDSQWVDLYVDGKRRQDRVLNDIIDPHRWCVSIKHRDS